MATANLASCLCPVSVRSATDNLILSSSCGMVKSLTLTACSFCLQLPQLLCFLTIQTLAEHGHYCHMNQSIGPGNMV